ncbi:unnamed protein product [Cladocopium goreaui]|uniref:AB hydrolase-1 domain-containing protein n=1 Tax=Cladocopium goreaui TaxID=2562237 RepID=A0A9P1D3E8_9DINO|nr:unnamed protein product [Cladocopium goreaui]
MRKILCFSFTLFCSATFWTCDEVVSEQCELTVHKGQVAIQSIPVTYWRYRARSSPVHLGPLVALHGGPSWPHNYLLPLKYLACHGVSEVIFYDQAGCGESAPPKRSLKDFPHLLDTKYYSQIELPELLRHWNLDDYHLLGHSWGTILAQLFVLNAPTESLKGLASMVLAGPLSDSQSYIRAQWDKDEGNLGSLPPFVQGRIQQLEAAHRYNSAEYETISAVLTTFFTLRTAPAPDCFVQSNAGMNRDIYVAMQGASEFTMSGVLADFNVTGRLHEIEVPVLLTSGRFDTMRPSVVRRMHQELRYSEWKMFPHSGHVSMIDDADETLRVVADFLGRVHMANVTGQFVSKDWDEAPDFPGFTATSCTSSSWLLMISTLLLGVLLGSGCSAPGKSQEEYMRLE